ncbi:MAG TPA: hypothetical protein VJ489_03775 [Thermoplasmata archaeon]|nr:hypothetical protein [Thermoplasmata archaeon]
MYYCPRCDRAIAKERVEGADRELKSRFGMNQLSHLKCPVCDTEYIDLDRVKAGGGEHIGRTRKKS